MSAHSNNSNWVPNSFQTPNEYADKLMELLTEPEYKVLSFMCRRILGFNKDGHQDYISISQFTDGIKSKFDGKRLSGGTGLGKGTVEKCLTSLEKFGIIKKVASNNRKINNGDLWRLVLDSNKIDWNALDARDEAKKQADRNRFAAGRAARASRRASTIQ